MVANHGLGHPTNADDDGFILVRKKKKMVSIQLTIKEHTNKKMKPLLYKLTNPYEVLSNDEVKVKDEEEKKEANKDPMTKP